MRQFARYCIGDLPFPEASFDVALSTYGAMFTPGHTRPEPHMVTLFGAQAANITCTRKMFNFRYLSAAHWVQVFRDCYGPTYKAFAALEPAKQAAMER